MEAKRRKKEKRKVKRETNYYINDVTTTNAAKQFSVMVHTIALFVSLGKK